MRSSIALQFSPVEVEVHYLEEMGLRYVHHLGAGWHLHPNIKSLTHGAALPRPQLLPLLQTAALVENFSSEQQQHNS